jgi:hypothetical protein
VRVHAEHAAVETDPALTEQMVEILLTNASRRSRAGSPVWVQVSSDPGGAVIAVDDTCAEIPSGMRVEGTAAGSPDGGPGRKRPKGATGLALLSRLAELHGGKAWVEARSGGGASFRVFLPSASQEPHARGSDEDATAHDFEDEHDKNRRRRHRGRLGGREQVPDRTAPRALELRQPLGRARDLAGLAQPSAFRSSRAITTRWIWLVPS